MQHYSPEQKRKQLALRYFGYGMMSLIVIIVSALCVLWALGYRFDFLHRTVEQGALLQYRSYPDNASITLDNLSLSFRTPGKSTVSAGSHTVTMQIDGYREWSKTAKVAAGELRWLNYARLVPTTVTTTNIKEFPVISDALPSPDRKWLALVTDPAKPELVIADLRDRAKITYSALTIPAALFATTAGQGHHFSVEKWDYGGRFLLVKHVSGAVVEYLRLDRTGGVEPLNLTTKFNFLISNAHFSGTSGNVFYVQDKSDIRRLDVGAGTLSEPITSGVLHFTQYRSDTLSYVRDRNNKRVVGLYLDNKARAVREYDVTQPVLVGVSSYFYDTYMAIARGTAVEIIKNPQDKTSVAKTYVSFTVPTSVEWLQFSNNGRFVVAGSGTQFVTYDLETKETYTVNLPGAPADSSQPLQWLDDYILVSSADGNIRFSEFDGGNQHVITDGEPGLAVTLTEDQKALISITRTTNGFALQSSNMVVK